MAWRRDSFVGYRGRNWVSGGRLEVPKKPVERIMLYAKLARLKRDAGRRSKT